MPSRRATEARPVRTRERSRAMASRTLSILRLVSLRTSSFIAARLHDGAHFFAERLSFHISRLQHFEDDDGDMLFHGHGYGGAVHDPEGFFQDVEIGKAGEQDRLAGFFRGPV